MVAERELARHTTRLVAVGQQVRGDLLAAGIGRGEQYSVVAPGVRPRDAPDRDRARSALALPAAAKVVTLVARLTPIKRPDRFLDVAEAVALRHPDAVFVVAGGGELLGALRARGHRSRVDVRFLGWRSDVETVYAASDVVALTSDNEGMPVSLIEAAMAGRPCVTTRVGAAPEVVIDGVTGYVTGLQVADLANAVNRLLDDDRLRSGMGAAARERAGLHFSAQRLIADLSGIYEELVGTQAARTDR